MNPFTKQPHSAQYKNLLATRQKLPMYKEMEGFMRMFTEQQIIIVAGEPGSGKTTQIPQFVAYSDMPHTRGKLVACTQPSRIAAISAANRVAVDGCPARQAGRVFRSVRRRKRVRDDLSSTHDGRRASPRSNERPQSWTVFYYHPRRSTGTDCGHRHTGWVFSKLSPKSVPTSKSSSCPSAVTKRNYKSTPAPTRQLLQIPGRTHPIEVFYTQVPESDYVEAAIHTVLMIYREEGPGDILLFLTGEEDIKDACWKITLEVEAMMKENPESVPPIKCIPLYPSLPHAQVQHVFDGSAPNACGSPGRKVVVSTDTSQHRKHAESLLVSPILKSAAQLRKAYAGRMRPGKCFRLYTEKDFTRKLDEETPPEILTSNLSLVILQMVKLGVKDLVRFDWLDQPAPEALELLNYLAALDDTGNPTGLGSVMAEFPLDPQLAKALVISPEFKCSSEILTIVAMLSVGSPWMRPPNARSQADAAKGLFTVPDGDHLTLLNVYNQWQDNKHDRNWAYNNFLDLHALRDAEKAHSRLDRVMERHDIELLSLADKKKLFENI